MESSSSSSEESSEERSFVVSFEDKAGSSRVTSSLQCLFAHDFRNYLGVIGGHCELISEMGVNEGVMDHLRRISDTVAIMSRILDRCNARCKKLTEGESGGLGA